MQYNLQTQILQFIGMKKEVNLTLNIPVYNPIKAMSVFLTASETQCIIYRPELPNSQASRKSLKSS